MTDLRTIWTQAQPLIKEQVGTTSYDTWFSTLQLKDAGDRQIVIDTPDEFFKNWIVEHYMEKVLAAVKTTAGEPIDVAFDINPGLIAKRTRTNLPEFEKKFQEEKVRGIKLNPRCTFDNFVIGGSNRFASAACLAVGESPGKAYNPLFIYGHVGLGKTHLMQAIAHKINQTHPSLKQIYLPSERFTNELIDAIRTRSTAQFRQKYRHMDVLLIDDIHFIAGKESTQEEFFHTFNALHDSGKQIIISSDRPPKEIARLEERLVSRFAWGLITDIHPPDFETRVAILHKKIEREPVDVPDGVVTFIADQIKTNIRELEGALIRVIAYSLLEEKPISLDMAKVTLKDMVKETSKIISVEMVQKTVASFYKISLADLRAKRRHRNLVIPRQVAMYLSRKLTNMSLPEIGNAFGGKDHTTVLHSYRKIDQTLLTNSELRNTVDTLTLNLTD